MHGYISYLTLTHVEGKEAKKKKKKKEGAFHISGSIRPVMEELILRKVAEHLRDETLIFPFYAPSSDVTLCGFFRRRTRMDFQAGVDLRLLSGWRGSRLSCRYERPSCRSPSGAASTAIIISPGSCLLNASHVWKQALRSPPHTILSNPPTCVFAHVHFSF